MGFGFTVLVDENTPITSLTDQQKLDIVSDFAAGKGLQQIVRERGFPRDLVQRVTRGGNHAANFADQQMQVLAAEQPTFAELVAAVHAEFPGQNETLIEDVLRLRIERGIPDSFMDDKYGEGSWGDAQRWQEYKAALKTD